MAPISFDGTSHVALAESPWNAHNVPCDKKRAIGIPARFPSDADDITREAREMPTRWPLDTHGIVHGMPTGYLA